MHVLHPKRTGADSRKSRALECMYMLRMYACMCSEAFVWMLVFICSFTVLLPYYEEASA